MMAALRCSSPARSCVIAASIQALFRNGSYVPLALEGEQDDRFVAFLRQEGEEQFIVIAAIRLGPEGALEKLGQGTRVVLPEDVSGDLKNLFTSKKVTAGKGQLEIAETLDGLPIAVLYR